MVLVVVVLSLTHVQLFATTWTIHVHGILQARILEWVAVPFSGGSSQPRDWTQISHIAGGFFTSCATREAQEYWSGWPTSSSADPPDPGIKLGPPALQADSLPIELSGKPPKFGMLPEFACHSFNRDHSYTLLPTHFKCHYNLKQLSQICMVRMISY